MQSTAKLRYLSATILLFALSSTLMLSVSATGNQEVAASTISEAERLMVQTYDDVLHAEKVDADISGLLVRLNDAAVLLSEARMAFDIGDFEETINLAETTRMLLNLVGDEAELLEIESNSAQVNRSWWFMFTSVLGVSIVLVASSVGYEVFKRRYYRRLSKMQPRVE